MSSPGNLRLVGALGASAAALALGYVAAFEGKSNEPYWDAYGKVWTVCYGETRVAMRRYSDAECEDMLAAGIADFAKPVLAINPELRGHDNQAVAATSLAYNIGIANYQRSTVSKRFRAGEWKAACDAFLSWTYAGGKQLKGLVNRRRAERALCLKGLQ